MFMFLNLGDRVRVRATHWPSDTFVELTHEKFATIQEWMDSPAARSLSICLVEVHLIPEA